MQFFNRDFNVVGDEAFLPKNSTSQIGLFTLQQVDLGALRVEGGLRYEASDLEANPADGDLRFFCRQASFRRFFRIGGPFLRARRRRPPGPQPFRTERAPSAEELFARGGHAGTQSWEVGSPDFKLEKSWGIEGTLHVHQEGFNFDASAYYNWFSNYISENQVDTSVCEAAAAPSGREADLPCFQFQQADARYYGFEANASVRGRADRRLHHQRRCAGRLCPCQYRR